MGKPYLEKYLKKTLLTDGVICRSHLISLPQYDLAIAQALDAGNALATVFAMQLVQLYLIDERQATHVTETDLFHTIEMLVRMTTHRPPEGYKYYKYYIATNINF